MFSLIKGSTVLEVDMSNADADFVMADPRSASVPNLLAVTDPSTGQVAIPSSDVSIGLIVGIVFGVLVLIAILIVVTIFRLRKSKDHSTLYIPMDVPAYTPAAAPKMLNLKMIQGCVASGEGTISASEGTIVLCNPKDFADTASEWIWIQSGSTFGYVPREFTRLV